MELKKMNPSKVLLDIKAVTRIKYSEEAKNTGLYGNLYEQIRNKKVCVRDLNSGFDEKARSAILNKKIKANLFNKIRCEWVVDDRIDRVEEQIPCQLCHKGNNRIYYIRNKVNGKVLHIGSTCVKGYLSPHDFAAVNKLFDEQQEDRKKEQRIIDFGLIEIDDPEFINRIRMSFINIDIILPEVIYKKIDQALYEIDLLKSNYISQSGDYTKVSSDYILLKKEITRFWTKAEAFYQKYKHHRLSCNKLVSDWLKNQNRPIWIKVSKNGLLDIETIKYVYHPAYINKNIKYFSRCIDDNSLSIVGISDQYIKFKYDSKSYINSFSFYVSNKNFMSYIGCNCLMIQDYRFGSKEIKDMIKLEVNINTVETLYRNIMNCMKKVGLSLEIEDVTNTLYIKKTQEVYRRQNLNEMYLEMEISKFCQLLNILVFQPESVVLSRLMKWKERLDGNWISQKEKQDKYQLSRGLTYQKAKEYTHY